MREIDIEFGYPKGSAFRAFKYNDTLEEPDDFELLDNCKDSDRIQALKETKRIYATTINAVLLTESGYRKVKSVLADSH
ncbi:hypothetical protein HKX42_03165 [Salinisphaera sp. USBA-960]|uniref:hypothetical protein n=1 Tax=Salinisphaera orenii TaxID=856731 RepID=UPI0013A658F9|nr:hypothetical protein [Salifodinibacter halophilus]NNC25878.1 hypothetical protein [Salifodinibacter halophilus]